MSDFSNPIFHDETKARKWLEARVWPNGPVCPKCGVVGEARLMQGKSHRPGLYQCNACRQPFTVTVGTLYERSKIPLHKWLAATHLMMASKKGMSALEIGRLLGFSKKTAWFVCHRIRESLRETNLTPLGGEGKFVEADETYVGGKEKNKHVGKRKRENIGGIGKEAVFALVERGGRVRSQQVPSVSEKDPAPHHGGADQQPTRRGARRFHTFNPSPLSQAGAATFRTGSTSAREIAGALPIGRRPGLPLGPLHARRLRLRSPASHLLDPLQKNFRKLVPLATFSKRPRSRTSIVLRLFSRIRFAFEAAKTT